MIDDTLLLHCGLIFLPNIPSSRAEWNRCIACRYRWSNDGLLYINTIIQASILNMPVSSYSKIFWTFVLLYNAKVLPLEIKLAVSSSCPSFLAFSQVCTAYRILQFLPVVFQRSFNLPCPPMIPRFPPRGISLEPGIFNWNTTVPKDSLLLHRNPIQPPRIF